MWKPIYQPEPWPQYLNKKENAGVPLMEVRKKYMEEQLLFENYVSNIQQLNVLSPSNGAAGGPSDSPVTPPPTPPTPEGGDLCFLIEDASYTLVKVEGGDEYISSTYYMSYEGVSEWFKDRENSLVIAWNGSNWGVYFYSDAAAGQWVAGVSYTNYLGDIYESNGPEYDVVSGGTNPDSPVGTVFEDGYNIVENPCTAGAGKELEYDKYHIISRFYLPHVYPELLPDYISPIGKFADGYPSLFQTGSDFFSSQSLETYYGSVVEWVDNFLGTSYSAFIEVPTPFPELQQQLKNQSTNPLGDYNDGNDLNTVIARIEGGEIPNVVIYADLYDTGKGSNTSYINYIGKDSSGVAEYGGGSLNLRWNGSVWVLTLGGESGTDSTDVNNASGTYEVDGTTHIVTVHQTNANG